MPPKQVAFHEGAVLAMPMPDGRGYAAVVISRRAVNQRPNRTYLLCYGFGPRAASPEALALSGFKAENASLVGCVRERDLALGGCYEIAQIVSFDKAQWPFPVFVSLDPSRLVWRLVPYLESTVNVDWDSDWRDCTPEEASNHPVQSLFGVEAFAYNLDRAIDGGWRWREPVEEVMARTRRARS